MSFVVTSIGASVGRRNMSTGQPRRHEIVGAVALFDRKSQ
jgi:hypothetical protein